MITIRDGSTVIFAAEEAPDTTSAVAYLHFAAIRMFRQGKGFPVTFLGFPGTLASAPSSQTTYWFHPGMTLAIDYGTSNGVAIYEDVLAADIYAATNSPLGIRISAVPGMYSAVTRYGDTLIGHVAPQDPALSDAFSLPAYPTQL